MGIGQLVASGEESPTFAKNLELNFLAIFLRGQGLEREKRELARDSS